MASMASKLLAAKQANAELQEMERSASSGSHSSLTCKSCGRTLVFPEGVKKLGCTCGTTNEIGQGWFFSSFCRAKYAEIC
jgi:LSD1 subclass zinc finger protein